jgi:hypothetical protein
MYPKSHDNFKMIGPNSPFLQFIGLNNLAFANGHTWKKQRKVKKKKKKKENPKIGR